MTEQNNFALISETQKSNGSPTVVFAARFDMDVVRYRGKNHKVDTFDVRSSHKIKELFGKRKWNIIIEVGFLDLDEIHHSFNPANNVTYGELLVGLKRVGYDPLLPIRSKSFKDKVERVIGLKIQQANRKIKRDSHHTIREKIIPYAREIRDFVRDYIRGGIAPGKPALAGNTVRFRYSKNELHSEFYSYRYGINEPLWETGQLEQAVDFRVYYAEETIREKIARGEKKAIADMIRKKRRSINKVSKSAPIEADDGRGHISWAGAKSRGQVFVAPRPIKAAIVARAISGKKPKKILDDYSPNLKPGEVDIFDDVPIGDYDPIYDL